MTSEEKKCWAAELLKRKAEELGRLPKKDDFDEPTRSRIKAYLGPWPRALEAAGLKEAKPVSQKSKKRKKTQGERRAVKLSMHTDRLESRFGAIGAIKMIAEAGFEAIDWALDQQWQDGAQRLCWNRPSIESGTSFEQNSIYNEDMDTIIAHYQPEIDTIKKYGPIIDKR